MVHCSVCGFPIMSNGCPHTILNLTPEQWREKVNETDQQGDGTIVISAGCGSLIMLTILCILIRLIIWWAGL